MRPKISRLRIAAVMDDFTFQAFASEADILRLDPIRWLEELDSFQPDLLFIESAWTGQGELWAGLVSAGNRRELAALTAACRARGIPSLFWNKEDPVHYAVFLPSAALADFVFSTDLACLPKYTKDLGHQRVFLLPFAAQPLLHNPLAKYARKRAFNFAGTYYWRYLERQKAFKTMVDEIRKRIPVEIYDRNLGRDLFYFTYPEEYQGLILGRLDYGEIDRAYKGYEFGLNLNTVTQSQTMFARRVFELAASGTLVVSNYSRAVRLFFGDLVGSTDDPAELGATVDRWLEDSLYARKLRLLALRKVLAEHTYARRLRYIASTMGLPVPVSREQPPVVLVARADSQPRLEAALAAFDGLAGADNRRLLIIAPAESFSPRPDVTVCRAPGEAESFLAGLDPETLLGVLNPGNYYGPHYLTDLRLAFAFARASACGKGAFYQADGEGRLTLTGDGRQYSPVESLPAEAALARLGSLSGPEIKALARNPEQARFASGPGLAIDEFNYVQNGARLSPMETEAARDLPLADQGLSIDRILAAAGDWLKPGPEPVIFESDPSFLTLDAAWLHQYLAPAFTGRDGVRLSYQAEENSLELTSELPAHKVEFFFPDQCFDRSELNLENNSSYALRCSGSRAAASTLHISFDYFPRFGPRLGYETQVAGETQALLIPPECRKVRFGLRLEGPGRLKIKALEIGARAIPQAAFLFRGESLLVVGQGDDQLGLGARLASAYARQGLVMDIFSLSSAAAAKPFRKTAGPGAFDVLIGAPAQLAASLALGGPQRLLVRYLNEELWIALKTLAGPLHCILWWPPTVGESISAQWRAALEDPLPNMALVLPSREAWSTALDGPEKAWQKWRPDEGDDLALDREVLVDREIILRPHFSGT